MVFDHVAFQPKQVEPAAELLGDASQVIQLLAHQAAASDAGRNGENRVNASFGMDGNQQLELVQ
jgi:hypothetical protein